MTGTALVMAAALSSLVQQVPAPPAPQTAPSPPRPGVQVVITPPPPTVCRMPVVRGDNRADPKFVMAPAPSLDVRFSIRRTPGEGEKAECPDPMHPKR